MQLRTVLIRGGRAALSYLQEGQILVAHLFLQSVDELLQSDDVLVCVGDQLLYGGDLLLLLSRQGFKTQSFFGHERRVQPLKL